MNRDAQTLQIEITIRKAARQRRTARTGEDPEPPRIPRVTRLLALAIKFQDMVDRGELRDYADLARLGYVSRARITQIMGLLNLAPDIQEEILLGPLADRALAERHLRPVASETFWQQQRLLWALNQARCFNEPLSPRL